MAAKDGARVAASPAKRPKLANETALEQRTHPRDSVRARVNQALLTGNISHRPVSSQQAGQKKRRGAKARQEWLPWQGPLPNLLEGAEIVEVDFDARVQQWAELRETGVGKQHEANQRLGVYRRHFSDVLGLQWRDHNKAVCYVDVKCRRIVAAFLPKSVPDAGVLAPARTHMGRLSELNDALDVNRDAKGRPPLRLDGGHECRGPCRVGDRFMVGFTVARDRVKTIISNAGSHGNESVAANAKAIRGAVNMFDRMYDQLDPAGRQCCIDATPSHGRLAGAPTPSSMWAPSRRHVPQADGGFPCDRFR